MRNPGNSEYLSRPPTIADYVSSTWKPEEYSRTNTAKIVDSEKLAEAHKNPDCPNEQGKVNNEPPLAPPPYHIAAAFSKKAALFQQLNRRDLVDDISSHSHTTDNHSRNSFNDSSQVQLCQNNNQNNSDQIDGDVGSRTIDLSIDKNFVLKEDKPSRIPILRGNKNHESICDNDVNFTGDGNYNMSFNELDDRERNHQMILSGIEAPVSPVTGRKYRSPLSNAHNQLRHSDRGRKMNGSFMEGQGGLSGHSGDNSIDMQNERNSGRSTPVGNGEGDVNGVERSNGRDEGRPRLKWMFGPHRNVNVVRIQLFKSSWFLVPKKMRNYVVFKKR